MNTNRALERYKSMVEKIDTHADILTDLSSKTKDNLEGNCFTMHQTTIRNEALLTKRVNLLESALHGPKILELGFNAGHSALLFLLGCDESSEIDFLDIGAHPYVYPCYQYLESISSVKKRLLIGNSLRVLPELVLKHKQRDIYDVIHMDGGHSQECVMNDLILLYILLKPGGWMIVDDANGFILHQVNSFLSLGLFKIVEGQLETNVYPHIIVEKI
jgi:hypothetical protein